MQDSLIVALIVALTTHGKVVEGVESLLCLCRGHHKLSGNGASACDDPFVPNGVSGVRGRTKTGNTAVPDTKPAAS